MCAGYHGSTALESVLMSSKELGTLCRAGVWQCEGDNVLCSGESCRYEWARNRAINEDVRDPGWNYTTALREWSNYWPLDRHVLLEKTPSQWLRIKDTVKGLRAAPLPQRFVQLGVRRLTIKVVLMWRPWCLALLSSTARKSQSKNYTRWAIDELVHLNSAFAARHRALTAAGVPCLVISYSDLLFRFDDTARRLKGFLPCLGKLNNSFVPVLGRDIFPGNQWKVRGSVASFSLKWQAEWANMSDGLQCNAREGQGHDAVPAAQQNIARDSELYLRRHSRANI